jgi:hypothetical protein
VEDDSEMQRRIIIQKIKLQRQNGESDYDQVRGPPRPVNGNTETGYVKVDLETNCSNTMNLNDQMK